MWPLFTSFSLFIPSAEKEGIHLTGKMGTATWVLDLAPFAGGPSLCETCSLLCSLFYSVELVFESKTLLVKQLCQEGYTTTYKPVLCTKYNTNIGNVL